MIHQENQHALATTLQSCGQGQMRIMIGNILFKPKQHGTRIMDIGIMTGPSHQTLLWGQFIIIHGRHAMKIAPAQILGKQAASLKYANRPR